MLMGHPPPIIARGREDAPQGCFEGLTPVQVPMVVEELVARNSQVQETLADPLEVVQERLLLDSRVVDVSMASNPTFAFFSSLRPLFFNSCSGSQLSNSGLANIASGWLTIGATGLQISVSAHIRCQYRNSCHHNRFARALSIVLFDVS